MLKIILAIMIAVIATCTFANAEEERIAFPKDYATTFENYLSLDRVQDLDQIIRIFANDTALNSRKENGELPDGSILVGEVYSAKKDADGKVILSSLGQRIKDKLVVIAVMEKEKGWGDAYPDELKNGDWDFAVFSPDGKRLNKDLNACRQCHAPLKNSDHVFSFQHVMK